MHVCPVIYLGLYKTRYYLTPFTLNFNTIHRFRQRTGAKCKDLTETSMHLSDGKRLCMVPLHNQACLVEDRIDSIKQSRNENTWNNFLPSSVMACTSKVLYGCPISSIPKTSTMYFDEDKSPVNSFLSSLPFTILWTALLLLFLFDFNKMIKHWICLPRRVVRFVHWTEKLDEVSLLIFKFQPGSPGADKSESIS